MSSSSIPKRCEGAAKRSICARCASSEDVIRQPLLKQISERMVFDHLIYLREKEKLRPSTLNQAVVALRMFYRDYLQRDWKLWEQFETRRDRPLPVVLTRDEVHQLLRAVGDKRFKAVLTLIYHCGLRVGEAVRLRPKGHRQ